jgi:hypothetical protein
MPGKAFIIRKRPHNLRLTDPHKHARQNPRARSLPDRHRFVTRFRSRTAGEDQRPSAATVSASGDLGDLDGLRGHDRARFRAGVSSSSPQPLTRRTSTVHILSASHSGTGRAVVTRSGVLNRRPAEDLYLPGNV